MTKNLYKFPCSCGSEQLIEISQAGAEINCPDCGTVRVVPTLLKIKQLEKVIDNPNKRREETGVLRRGFFWFGLILLLPSIVALILFTISYPQPRDVSTKKVYFSYGETILYQNSTPIPQHEHVILWATDAEIDMMLPFDLYRYFDVLKSGANFSYNFQMNYQELKYIYYTRIAISVILVLLSAASIITSFFLPKRNIVIDGWTGNEWERKK
ncbi:MAG: hypothetical protein LBC74_03160 [Planctomycetaceae bacterium]|jgi:DNA-directed RNA polymerase subunit RPC12/RpoP|nr:hypothetical protein [Planctomycetaceae bacterium]